MLLASFVWCEIQGFSDVGPIHVLTRFGKNELSCDSLILLLNIIFGKTW